MLESALEELGLTKSETKVYLSLLELGSTTAGKIIERSGVSSSKIYEILDRLMHKGLASAMTSGGIRYFEAAPPERIQDYLAEREARLLEQKRKLATVIPQLDALRQSSRYESRGTIYKGLRGVETALFSRLHTMRAKSSACIRGCWMDDAVLGPLLDRFCMTASQKKIRVKIMAPEGKRMRQRFDYVEEKFTQQNIPAITVVLESRVVIIPERNTEPLAIVIDTPTVAESFRAEFDQIWNQQARTLRGIGAIKLLCEDILKEGGIDWIGARGYSVDVMKEYFADWERRANAKGIKVRNLVDAEIKGHQVTKWSFAKTKYTLPKEFALMSCFWIYKDKVAISNWARGDDPLVMIIEDPNIVKMYRKQFELLWRK